ncbi:MAG: hypothetical protein AAFU79_27325, partial [Myxococcota bacterium]
MMPQPEGLSPAELGQRVDPWLAGSVAFLLAVGVAAVYSGSAVLAAERFGDPSLFLLRHLQAIGVSLVVIYV